MALRLTAEERAFILKRREAVKEREAEKAAIIHGLYAALSLPFDQAYPIVRELACLREWQEFVLVRAQEVTA